MMLKAIVSTMKDYKVHAVWTKQTKDSIPAGRGAVVIHGGGGSSDIHSMDCSAAELEELIKESSHDEHLGIIKMSHSPEEAPKPTPPAQEWWLHSNLRSIPVSQDPPPPGNFSAAFSQMMVTFFYGGKLVGSMLSTHPEGCRISLPPPPPAVAVEALYGPESLQNIRFPSVELIEHDRQRHVTRKLFGHLERGVLVRANREGIFIKRLCQSRVFWSSQGSQYSPGPCKLERDAVVKIFDVGRFLQALQMYRDGHYPAPDPNVTLCFGEEFHDISTAKNKLIIVQITPLTCQQLLEEVNIHRSQYSSGNMDMADESQNEQVARIFQELCSYSVPQRLSFRENMPITV